MERILETSRMYLRGFHENDYKRLAEIYTDEEVMKYIGVGATFGEDKCREIIDAWKNKYYPEYGFGVWALFEKKSDLLIGHCGFNWLQDKSDVEIAYLLAKDFWGKGFATEIASATLEYGFSNLNLKRIVALSYPENVPSINVIKKLGMSEKGEKEYFGKRFLFFSKEKFM